MVRCLKSKKKELYGVERAMLIMTIGYQRALVNFEACNTGLFKTAPKSRRSGSNQPHGSSVLVKLFLYHARTLPCAFPCLVIDHTLLLGWKSLSCSLYNFMHGCTFKNVSFPSQNAQVD